jgi:hypothetical protein
MFPMVEVMKYFGMKAGDFRTEWSKLTVQDKAQLTAGIKNGTLTY